MCDTDTALRAPQGTGCSLQQGCQTVPGLLTNRGEHHAGECQPLWKQRKPFPASSIICPVGGKAEREDTVTTRQGTWNCALFFSSPLPLFGSVMEHDLLPEVQTSMVSSLLSCKETIVISKEAVKQQNLLLEAPFHAQLNSLIFSLLAKGLCEQRLLLTDREENQAKLHFLLLSLRAKNQKQGKNSRLASMYYPWDPWMKKISIIIIIITFLLFPYKAEAHSTWMPPAPLRSGLQTLKSQQSSAPGPSQLFIIFQMLCWDPGPAPQRRIVGSTLHLTGCIRKKANSLCAQTPRLPGLPSSRQPICCDKAGEWVGSMSSSRQMHAKPSWRRKVRGSEVLLPVPYWV